MTEGPPLAGLARPSPPLPRTAERQDGEVTLGSGRGRRRLRLGSAALVRSSCVALQPPTPNASEVFPLE